MDKQLIAAIELYRLALLTELREVENMTSVHRRAEFEKMEAITGAIIDGKNADARKRQQAEALALCEAYQDALSDIQATEHDKALASIEVRVIEMQLGMTKAWLYSQSGIGS